jgi:ABC-type lipoprotein export system ATPase subunit
MTAEAAAALVVCEAAGRTYGHGGAATVALQPTDCQINPGDRVALIGPSGSGKSTLLHLIAGLEDPTVGTISWPGIGSRGDLRPGPVAVIFQGPSLLAPLTVEENVALALVLDGLSDAEAHRGARNSLELLDLIALREKLPEEISGGQAQRVAVARAVAGAPRLILADEPTGSLDSSTGASIMQLIRELNAAGATILMITHDAGLADQLPRRIRMLDGKVVSDTAGGLGAPAAAVRAATGGQLP